MVHKSGFLLQEITGPHVNVYALWPHPLDRVVEFLFVFHQVSIAISLKAVHVELPVKSSGVELLEVFIVNKEHCVTPVAFFGSWISLFVMVILATSAMLGCNAPVIVSLVAAVLVGSV